MKATALILTSLVLAAAAQQPATKPGTNPPAKPAANPPAPKRELSDAERRALQDNRSAAEVRELLRQKQEAQRLAEAGTAEADRVTSKLPDSAKEAANSPEAKAALEKAKAAASSKDPAAIKKLADQAKDALGEDGGKAMIDAAKQKLSDRLGKSGSGTGSVEDIPDDEPIKPVPLKPLTEPLTPRARPTADTSFDVGADDITFPMPKSKEKGKEPVAASDRTIFARGNVIVRSPSFSMQSGEFDGVMAQDFDMKEAGKKPKTNKADIVNPGAAVKAQSPFADMPFESAVARNRVIIVTKDQDGNPVRARGGSVSFTRKSEAMVLKDYPEALVDNFKFIGEGPGSIIIIYPGKEVHLKDCNMIIGDGKPMRMQDGKLAISTLQPASKPATPAPATPRPAAAPASAPRSNPPAAPARTP